MEERKHGNAIRIALGEVRLEIVIQQRPDNPGKAADLRRIWKSVFEARPDRGFAPKQAENFVFGEAFTGSSQKRESGADDILAVVGFLRKTPEGLLDDAAHVGRQLGNAIEGAPCARLLKGEFQVERQAGFFKFGPHFEFLCGRKGTLGVGKPHPEQGGAFGSRHAREVEYLWRVLANLRGSRTVGGDRYNEADGGIQTVQGKPANLVFPIDFGHLVEGVQEYHQPPCLRILRG